MAGLVIETEGLTKLYGEKIGCRDVSISVRSIGLLYLAIRKFNRMDIK